MAISHAISGQALDVKPYGEGFAAHQTRALFKSHDLEVIRLVLLEGKSFPPHRVAGDITIQCLEGLLAIELEGEELALGAGQLLFLERDAMHGVTATTDASALVTIALRPSGSS